MSACKIYRIDRDTPAAAEPAAASRIFKHLAEALECRLPAPTRSAQLLARLRALPPADTRTVRASASKWRALAPGVKIKLLRSDAAADDMTAFIRMQPHATLDAHWHRQPEECLVLEGEIVIGACRLRAGDMLFAAAGTSHASINSPRGALLLVRAQLCQGH
jgi:quercetin dioxygenase-like cupin family protein